MRRVWRWYEKEMILLCRCGFHGVVAAGIVTTILLSAPIWAVEAWIAYKDATYQESILKK